MSEPGSINILCAIACDDIRQEVTGKHILIGAYAGNMGLPFFPVTIVLGFWVLARPSHEGHYEVELRVQDPEGKEVSHGQMIMRVEKIEDSALVVPPMPIPLAKAGEIALQYREKEGTWKTICSLDARLVQPTLPGSSS